MAENSFKRDGYSSVYHRIAGKCCMLSDIDVVEESNSTTTGIWIEYMQNYGNKTFVALIDYKRVVKNETTIALGQLPVYRALSAELKNPVPVFAVLTYLDTDYPVKMYYVVPCCPVAEEFFNKYNFDLNGKWLTLQTFSKFQHLIRRKQWNENEEIKYDDIHTIKVFDPSAPVKYGMKLKDLPNKKIVYTLPNLSHLKGKIK